MQGKAHISCYRCTMDMGFLMIQQFSLREELACNSLHLSYFTKTFFPFIIYKPCVGFFTGIP